MFGGNQVELGSLDLNLILLTAGKIKIRYGKKFIDLLDNSGNINSSGMVSGAIIMWYGNNIPSGWAICDGNNGTPNLQDKFIDVDNGKIMYIIKK